MFELLDGQHGGKHWRRGRPGMVAGKSERHQRTTKQLDKEQERGPEALGTVTVLLLWSPEEKITPRGFLFFVFSNPDAKPKT